MLVCLVSELIFITPGVGLKPLCDGDGGGLQDVTGLIRAQCAAVISASAKLPPPAAADAADPTHTSAGGRSILLLVTM